MESVMLLRLPQTEPQVVSHCSKRVNNVNSCALLINTVRGCLINFSYFSSNSHISYQILIFLIKFSYFSSNSHVFHHHFQKKFPFSIMAPRRKWVRDWRCAKSSNQLVIKANCDPRSILGWKTIIVFISSQKPSDKILLWDSLKFRL